MKTEKIKILILAMIATIFAGCIDHLLTEE